MPIYEYACEKCEKVTEVLAKVDDPPPAKCPSCGGKKLHRVVSRSSFHLKGGGWYSDLYGGGKKSGGESSSSPAKPEPKSESKAESKSESKAEAKPAKAESKPKKKND